MYRIVFYQSDKGWEFEVYHNARLVYNTEGSYVNYPYTLIRALYCIKGLLDMLHIDQLSFLLDSL